MVLRAHKLQNTGICPLLRETKNMRATKEHIF